MTLLLASVITVLVVAFVQFRSYKMAVEHANDYSWNMRGEITQEMNKVLKHVSDDNKYLLGQLGSVQSGLDKFKNEVRSGVSERVNLIEKHVRGSNSISRLDALEDFLNIRPVDNTKQIEVQTGGLHYEKCKKS